MPIRRTMTALRIALFPLCIALAACGGSDDDDGGGGGGALSIFTSRLAAPASTTIAVSGNWIAYLADEATSSVGGSDLNGDTDVNDAVPIAIDAVEGLEYTLPAAARELHWLGSQLFFVVDESADQFDWNGDMALDDRVLVRWTLGANLAFVAVLDTRGSTPVAVVGDTLFFVAAEAPMGAMESSLVAIEAGDVLGLRPVLTNDALGTLRPEILALDEGLLLLGLDEQLEGRDLNGDGDSADRRVLALLDGTGTAQAGGYSELLLSLGLAARHDQAAPFRALSSGAGDWLAAFLVNESAQGDTNFNDPGNPAAELPLSWLPSQCASADADTLDDVLFFVRFAPFSANPGASPPVNTGLVGDRRIVIAGDFVGTLSPEAHEGSCSLNGDGDQSDRIFRWVRAQQPITPPTAVALLRAVSDLAGGTRGVAELQGRFVIAVNELADGRDIDGGGLSPTADFVGWIDPAAPTAWTFDHEPAEGEAYGIATWMGEVPGRQRLGIAFAESSSGLDINGDGDILDSIPTFALFGGTPVELVFPGFGAALPKENAGIVVQNGWAFFRVSEAEDDLDWNSDGDKADFVLLRSRLSDGSTRAESMLNDIAGRPAVEPADLLTPASAAFLAAEAGIGDINEDGRADGFALRYFRW